MIASPSSEDLKNSNVLVWNKLGTRAKYPNISSPFSELHPPVLSSLMCVLSSHV